MSPAVWTNNPFPAGCVPGGNVSDDLRCWLRMENAMHNKYWSSRRVINKLWLEEEKGRWSTWKLVHSLMWQRSAAYFYLGTQITLRHLNTHTGDPARWHYSDTHTDAAHAQVQTKAIKDTHNSTHKHTLAQDKDWCTNTRAGCAALLHPSRRHGDLWRRIPHRQKQKWMISRRTGWRGITRSVPLIKWKSRKIVLGGTNNWVRAIEGHIC